MVTNEKQCEGDDRADDNDVNPGAILWSRGRWHGIGLFGGLDPFRCDLKCPREDKREGEADDKHDNDQSDDPTRNIEHWKHLSDSLRQRPASDDVGNGNLIYIAPLKLGEKVGPRLHRFGVVPQRSPESKKRPEPHTFARLHGVWWKKNLAA